jgi:ABC-type tungstate transport system substrate-binding protein
MRTFLAYFNLVNFLVMIAVTVYLLLGSSEELGGLWTAIYAYYVILGCSGIVMALWIAIDGKRLEKYANKIRSLEKKLTELEKKIKLITK